MPSLPSKRLLSALSGCGLLLAFGLANGCSPGAAPGVSPDRTAVITPSPAATVKPTGSQQTQSISFKTQVAPLLETRCAACHSTPGKGGVSLFDGGGSPSYPSIKGDILRIISQVDRGAMPPAGGQRMTQSELQLLENWEMEGSPNN